VQADASYRALRFPILQTSEQGRQPVRSEPPEGTPGAFEFIHAGDEAKDFRVNLKGISANPKTTNTPNNTHFEF
jgi:hypothetical protein